MIRRQPRSTLFPYTTHYRSANLLTGIETQSKQNLRKNLEQQKNTDKHVNSKPGAMALAKNKMKLINEYNKKYVQTIKEKLES